MSAQGWKEALCNISPGVRRVVSADVVFGSLRFFRPTFGAVFSAETVRFVQSALESARSGHVDQAESDRISVRLYSLLDEDPAIGLASLVAALSLFFDCAAAEFDVDSTLEIMSSCYEAVLHTEGISQDMLDSNLDGANCSQLIDFQRGVIERASSVG
ncbi:hypothetical protein [Streptomyces hokutonensis]|uniref:hypothetical protein n=1 Tax=Streptomyces hokutonensis TaxID=1306990 RepID=UPI0036A78AD0